MTITPRPLVAVTMLLTSLGTAPLWAQGSPRRQTRSPAEPPLTRAVASINETDVRRRISILADDSMRGRYTPSPELEEVAEYIAGEFRRLGLRGGAEGGSHFQRYTIRRWAVDSTSTLMVMGRGVHAHWRLGREAAYGGGGITDSAVVGPVVLLVGVPADPERTFSEASLQGAVVLHVVRAPQIGRRLVPLIERGRASGARAWVFVSDRMAQAFVGLARGAMRARLGVAGLDEESGMPILEVRDSVATEVLRAAGEDLATLRSRGPAIRALPGLTASLNLRRAVLSEDRAPNVIGVLEGSDPVLRNEYVFFTAHMDGLGSAGAGMCHATGADSVCNGADDDASGTAGVVELAEAFAMLNPRPRRSMVFMTVSGEERGLWGSEYYSEYPTLPLSNTVAAFNIDMVGRNWRDTIVAIGQGHSSLGELANRAAREHPELNMRLIDDLWPQERFYERSDHYNFARKGVPILFFFNGVHRDYHQPTDTVDKIDAEKEARIIRLIFYIGLETANAEARPEWNPESRRRIVEAGSP
jgi:hypothetical protein